MSCPQIWNIEKEKDREKGKVGGRPANLNELKGDRDLERENPYSAVIKKLYASTEVKENALAPESKSCRPENNNYSQSI